MDVIIGLRTKDSVLLVTSKSLARGVSVFKNDDLKVAAINDHTAIAFSGEPGDTTNFVEYIQANVKLYGLRHDIELSTHAVASFVRKELSTSLRTRKPYQVNVLVGGYDLKQERPELHWIDYLGSNVELPYAAHGYAQYYILSTLDRYWKAEMNLDDGLKLARRCIEELQLRLPIDFKGCNIHVIDKDGIRLQESTSFDDNNEITSAANVGTDPLLASTSSN